MAETNIFLDQQAQITDLRAQLQQAQEIIAALDQEAGEASARLAQSAEVGLRRKRERDAAIEQAEDAEAWMEMIKNSSDFPKELLERAEAAEEKYDLALNACHIGLRLNDEYRQDAAEQRALAKRLLEPLLYHDHIGPFPVGDTLLYRITVRGSHILEVRDFLTPAEALRARSPQSGQEALDKHQEK